MSSKDRFGNTMLKLKIYNTKNDMIHKSFEIGILLKGIDGDLGLPAYNSFFSFIYYLSDLPLYNWSFNGLYNIEYFWYYNDTANFNRI